MQSDFRSLRSYKDCDFQFNLIWFKSFAPGTLVFVDDENRLLTPHVVHRLSASPATFRIWHPSFHLKEGNFLRGVHTGTSLLIREERFQCLSHLPKLDIISHHFVVLYQLFKNFIIFLKKKHRENTVNLIAVCTIHYQETENHLKLFYTDKQSWRSAIGI